MISSIYIAPAMMFTLFFFARPLDEPANDTQETAPTVALEQAGSRADWRLVDSCIFLTGNSG